MSGGISFSLTRERGAEYLDAALKQYKDGDHPLDRHGSINVDRKIGKNGAEYFQIELVGDIFRDRGRAVRWARSGEINLNTDALFQVVQRCRGRWEEAIMSARETVPGVGGVGEKSRFAYEENWKNPVQPSVFRQIGAKLAVAGARMFESIFEANRQTPRMVRIFNKIPTIARQTTLWRW